MSDARRRRVCGHRPARLGSCHGGNPWPVRCASGARERLAVPLRVASRSLACALAFAAQFEEDKSKCTAPHEEYKAHCMKSWRKYFDSRRKAGKGQVDVGTYRPGK